MACSFLTQYCICSTDVNASAGPIKDGPKRDYKNKSAFRKDERGPRKRGGMDDDRDSRNTGRTSLRLGTGRKGRGAELSQRRGSLKKRDRTAEREAREEAAIERRTVHLPK